MSMNPPGNFPAALLTAMQSKEPTLVADDESHIYETGYTFDNVPQRIGDVERHHYLQIFTIGVQSGPQNAQSISPGLTVGAIQRIIAEKAPSVWLISLSAKAGGGSVNVFEGEPGGPFIPLGIGGYAVIPSRGQSLTLVGVGATASGVVIAMGGFEKVSNPSPVISVGAY